MYFAPILIYARMILCIDLFFASPKQRGTNDLTAENSELKLQLQAMEQQLHLQEGKNISVELPLQEDVGPILSYNRLYHFMAKIFLKVTGSD